MVSNEDMHDAYDMDSDDFYNGDSAGNNDEAGYALENNDSDDSNTTTSHRQQAVTILLSRSLEMGAMMFPATAHMASAGMVLPTNGGHAVILPLISEAICSSLKDYNKEIEYLKQGMNNITHVSALAQGYTIIEHEEECVLIQFNNEEKSVASDSMMIRFGNKRKSVARDSMMIRFGKKRKSVASDSLGTTNRVLDEQSCHFCRCKLAILLSVLML